MGGGSEGSWSKGSWSKGSKKREEEKREAPKTARKRKAGKGVIVRAWFTHAPNHAHAHTNNQHTTHETGPQAPQNPWHNNVDGDRAITPS